MKQFVVLLIAVSLANAGYAQSSAPCPAEVTFGIHDLWKAATEGELLNADGWYRTSVYFLNREPWPGLKKIWVVSNYWAADLFSLKDNKAEVILGYEDAGSIDDQLRYTPPEPTHAIKTSIMYHLTLAPTHRTTYKADGKTPDKVITGPLGWHIEGSEGPPWATVNTAIRYVLEMRAKTKDPEIRKNADQTIEHLL